MLRLRLTVTFNPLEHFYKQNNCTCVFEKIQAIEHQLQLFPEHNIEVNKRLQLLEHRFMTVFNSFNVPSASSRSNSGESVKKWSEIYKEKVQSQPELPTHLLKAQQLGIRFEHG